MNGVLSFQNSLLGSQTSNQTDLYIYEYFSSIFWKKVAVFSVWFDSYWHWQKIDMEYFFSIGPKEMKFVM